MIQPVAGMHRGMVHRVLRVHRRMMGRFVVLFDLARRVTYLSVDGSSVRGADMVVDPLPGVHGRTMCRVLGMHGGMVDRLVVLLLGSGAKGR